jgi:hypothetical protein
VVQVLYVFQSSIEIQVLNDAHTIKQGVLLRTVAHVSSCLREASFDIKSFDGDIA